jgi:hypothetical protein
MEKWVDIPQRLLTIYPDSIADRRFFGNSMLNPPFLLVFDASLIFELLEQIPKKTASPEERKSCYVGPGLPLIMSFHTGVDLQQKSV